MRETGPQNRWQMIGHRIVWCAVGVAVFAFCAALYAANGAQEQVDAWVAVFVGAAGVACVVLSLMIRASLRRKLKQDRPDEEAGDDQLDHEHAASSDRQALHTLITHYLKKPSLDLNDTPVLNVNDVTSLQSVEVNLRTNRFDRFAMLAGFRHLTLRDSLSFRGDAPPDLGHFGLLFNSLNRLYGAQIGVDCYVGKGDLLKVGRFEIRSAIKAGIYGNTGSSGVSLEEVAKLHNSITVPRQSTAFVGDISVVGLFHLNDIWAIRAGYQFLWMSRVALASKQVPFFTVSGDPYPLSSSISGDVFLQGALVSLEASW